MSTAREQEDKRMTRRPIAFAAALAALMTMLAAGPASADGPVVEKMTLTITDEEVPCGDGITFDLDLDVQEVSQLFPNRTVTHSVVDGWAIASTGARIRFHHSWSETLDFVEQTVAITGLAFGASVEGTTITRMDRGRLVIDLTTGLPIFIAGEWTPGPFDPVEATCDLIRADQP